MKKKILIGVLAIFICLTIVGCGKKDNNTKENSNNNSNQTNTVKDNSGLELYSDDTKLVFELNVEKYIFYYTGDTVTAFHVYLDYGNEESAVIANQMISADKLENVDKHYAKGQYLVLEYNKSEYEDLKVSELRNAYSYMKEVTK